MIVKCPLAKLKPGMYLSNPGLSQSSNPHVYLAEGVFNDVAGLRLLTGTFCETYIDTEKGSYFASHPDEKTELESIFNTLVFTDEERKEGTGSLDDILANFKAAENKYVEFLGQYKAMAQKMASAKDVDLQVCERLVKSITDTEDKTLLAMLLVSRMRVYDAYSYTHSLNVSILAAIAARHFGFSEDVQTIFGMSGMIHDVGKIFIPDKILKKPKKLTGAEYAEIKRHPVYGMELLSKQKDLPSDVTQVAHKHHEQFDGSGYPLGLKGDEIGNTAALISIIDTYDALRSDRYYKEAVSSHKAICVVYSLKGKSFKPVMVDKLVKMIGIYPIGSIVVLKNGMKAIVSGQNSDNLLRPQVRVILDAANRHCDPMDVDLMREDDLGPFAIVDTLTQKECRVHVSALLRETCSCGSSK